MNKYNNGQIFKITNNVDDNIYIGSTIRALPDMLKDIKSRSHITPDRKVCEHLNTIGWDHVHIELIEKYPCSSKGELEKRERYHINIHKPTLNANKPSRTKVDIQEARAKHQQTDKRKEARARYYQTDKGKAYLERKRLRFLSKLEQKE